MSDTAAPAEPTDAELDTIVASIDGTPAPEPEKPAPKPEPAEEPAGDDTTAGADAEAAPEGEKPEAEDATAEPKTGTRRWERNRINQLSREKGDIARERDLLAKERDDLRAANEALKEGKPVDATALTATQIRQQAEEIAAATLAARDQAIRNDAFLKAGKTAFTDFDERCAVVASVANSISETKRFELMAIIGEMEDGPKVVAHLADNVDEAAALLAKPPHLMALALAKVEKSLAPPPAAAAPVKPVSKAPKPITPVGGQTVGAFDPYDETTSMKDWAAAMDRRDAQRRKARMRL